MKRWRTNPDLLMPALLLLLQAAVVLVQFGVIVYLMRF